jgi:hypothetical protein
LTKARKLPAWKNIWGLAYTYKYFYEKHNQATYDTPLWEHISSKELSQPIEPLKVKKVFTRMIKDNDSEKDKE